MKLTVAGGAKLGGGAKFAAGGLGNQVVNGVVADFPLAQFATHGFSGRGAPAFSVLAGGVDLQLTFFPIGRLWIPACAGMTVGVRE